MMLNDAPQDRRAHEASDKNAFAPASSKAAALLLAAILCVTFYGFRSNSLIGDGLRHLPALRTILPGTPPAFQPKPWLEIYRDHYDDLVVHNHLLFGATMRAAFALQQALGIRSDALVAMYAINALSSAIAGALFFLLCLRLGVAKWTSLALALGLCLSPAYLLAATNIAEIALPLPFFIGTLLLLTSPQFAGWTPVAAGVLAALAALTYLLAGALVPCIALAVIAIRFPSRSAAKPILLFLSSFGVVFAGLWLTVLVSSGYRSPARLLHAVLYFPQEGTYGGFKFGSLIAAPVGLTQAFLSVLPDDFVGLKSLLHPASWATLYVGAATLLVCAVLAIVFYVLFRRGAFRTLLVLSCLLTFLLVEAACVKWDPYYQKLQLFALILCWTMVAAALSSSPQLSGVRWPVFLFLTLVLAGGLWTLRKNVQPSQARANAQQLYAIVGNGELITAWSGDVMHMFLYSNLEHMVSLPDMAFARHLDSQRVQQDLNTLIQQAAAEHRNVYIYGLFDEKTGSPSDIYETRFRLTGITEYLRGLQQKSKPVARLPQPAGQSIVLYLYVP